MATKKSGKPAAAVKQDEVMDVHQFAIDTAMTDGRVWRDDEVPPTHTRVTPNDKGYVNWMFKLGAMLRDQFLPSDQHLGRVYYLTGLPTNYHLRVKYSKRLETTRSDYYLYGNPHGTKPRVYRNPVDFFPHLLWLLGGTNDRRNCSCTLCRDELPAAAPKQPTAGTAPAASSTNMARSNSSSSAREFKAAPTASNPQIESPLPQTTAVSQPASTPTLPAGQATPATPVTQPPVMTDTSEASLYRVGEIVWWKSNNAWRLGLVIQMNRADTGDSQYLIKPIAHSLLQLPHTPKPEGEIRPFATFSVPPVNEGLINNSLVAGRPFQSIDWAGLLTQMPGDDNQQKMMLLALDGSKMAAIAIDHSYSTFNPRPGTSSFGGVFLGAEKICVGEPLRVRLLPQDTNPSWSKTSPFIMVLEDIFIARSGEANGLWFRGNVWRLEESTDQQQLASQPPLPGPMVRERAFRNEVRKRVGLFVYWVMVQQNVTMAETSIRGRFYETQKLMPILAPDKYSTDISQNMVPDIQACLNNRRESKGNYVGRKRNRLDALTGAIPDGSTLDAGPNVVEEQ